MLTVTNLGKQFVHPVLVNINLRIQKGETLAIIGRSGVGKSSLLKIIAGQLQPSEGEVSWNGKRILGPEEQLLPGHPDIELVNQDFKLDPYHTAEENIRLSALHLPAKDRDRLVKDLIELFELDVVRQTKAHLLSGGEQQRVSLARALAKEPEVLLLDEPFSHLDSVMRSKLMVYLDELKKIRGLAMVLVSHDGTEILSLADRVAHLKKGRIRKVTTPSQLYYKPTTLAEARLLGHMNVVLIDGQKIWFRPNEYTLFNSECNGDFVILSKLIFEKSLFMGPFYENYFRTGRNERIQLVHTTQLHEIDKICIKKKA
jgi:iron(III) transport system ATP-binding protein